MTSEFFLIAVDSFGKALDTQKPPISHKNTMTKGLYVWYSTIVY